MPLANEQKTPRLFPGAIKATISRIEQSRRHISAVLEPHLRHDCCIAETVTNSDIRIRFYIWAYIWAEQQLVGVHAIVPVQLVQNSMDHRGQDDAERGEEHEPGIEGINAGEELGADA